MDAFLAVCLRYPQRHSHHVTCHHAHTQQLLSNSHRQPKRPHIRRQTIINFFQTMHRLDAVNTSNPRQRLCNKPGNFSFHIFSVTNFSAMKIARSEVVTLASQGQKSRLKKSILFARKSVFSQENTAKHSHTPHGKGKIYHDFAPQSVRPVEIIVILPLTRQKVLA